MVDQVQKALYILERTPTVLRQLLYGLDDEWIQQNEGPDTWSPFDVVGHLIHGERTDWMVRMQIILSDADDKTFAPFDRFAQNRESEGKSMEQLLDEFAVLRSENLDKLRSLHLTDGDLEKTGVHPALGMVTLNHLLSTWATHDLNHISQIVRVMASHYADEVGPWKSYLRILNQS